MEPVNSTFQALQLLLEVTHPDGRKHMCAVHLENTSTLSVVHPPWTTSQKVLDLAQPHLMAALRILSTTKLSPPTPESEA